MRGIGSQIPNNAAVIALVLSMLVHPASPANAGPLDVDVQLRYDLIEAKERGKPAVSDGRFLTSYGLSLRRPILPSSALVSDLKFNSSESGDRLGKQSTKNWTLNLYARQPKYTLMGRLNRSNYGSVSNLQPSSSTGSSTDYSVSMLLRQPAYPVVNVQFLRNSSDTSFGGSGSGYSTTSWLLSSYYDLAPLRFTVDRRRQTYEYSSSPGSSTTTQRMGVSINQALSSGLTMTGDLSRYSINTDAARSGSSLTTDRRLIRLSANPTRALAMDVDFSSQTTAQETGVTTRRNDNNSLSWALRSEIMPGLYLDYTDQRQAQTSTGLAVPSTASSRNRSAALSARLAQDTTFNVSRTASEYNTSSAGADGRQDGTQAAIQTALTPRTDLSLSYGQSRATVGIGDTFDSRFAGVSLRDRTSDNLSLGAAYRRSSLRSTFGVGSPLNQTNDTVDLDALWLPTHDLGIDLRLSYQANAGISTSETLSPSGNIRWQIASATSLIVNYGFERLRQWDLSTASILTQRSKGLSLRLTHGFRSGSSLDVAYDFDRFSFGQTEWQRLLRIYYTTRL